MTPLYYVTVIENGVKQYLGYASVFTANIDHARQMTEPVAKDKLHNYHSIGAHNRNKAHYKDAQMELVEEVAEVVA
jgi:hypothetical protein